MKQPSGKAKKSLAELKKQRKADALAFAQLALDMFNEKQASGKITNGHNNANQSKN